MFSGNSTNYNNPSINSNYNKSSLSSETFPNYDISFPHYEDEEEDVTEIDQVNSSKYWNVNVINEMGHISNTRYAHFVVDEDGEDKRLILLSTGKKWRGVQCLFSKYYKWDFKLEENLTNSPKGTNARNRKQLKIPRTLGSKSMARKRHKWELRYGRTYSRREMNSVTQLFLLHVQEKLEAAFEKVFGKEHPNILVVWDFE
ncbi:unnamed protein product [Vicia faba]|uniref:Uncharacterized protein n=1 Tax=Vicia faba TaxID=3906 RepID=A0AAV0ZG06_VICFA|nr:unnamed protein product [Vicia faba]